MITLGWHIRLVLLEISVVDLDHYEQGVILQHTNVKGNAAAGRVPIKLRRVWLSIEMPCSLRTHHGLPRRRHGLQPLPDIGGRKRQVCHFS